MKNLSLFILTLLLITTIACKRNAPDTFYFNCKIDGQYFEPEKPGGIGEYPITAKLLYNETDLRIDVSKGIQNVYLGIKDSTQIKIQEYTLSKNLTNFSRALYQNNLSGNHYETDSIFIGKTNIVVLDKQSMIVAGTFSFTAYNAILNDTVYITDGNFKLKYTLH